MNEDKKQESSQRLSKTLSRSGVASRRVCEDWIQKGRVRVNGKVVTQPQFPVSYACDRVEVDGKMIEQEEEKVYYLLNKPKGYLCSAQRRGKERIVLDLFEDEPKRLFTIGRLDKETEGLLLLTNDGYFAQRVIHPSYGVKKEYIAKTDCEITTEHLQQLSQGARIEGDWIRPFRVEKVRKGTVKLIVTEGKKHEVRLLLAHVGLEVRSLVRTRVGALRLGTLALGEWRPLTQKELSLF